MINETPSWTYEPSGDHEAFAASVKRVGDQVMGLHYCLDAATGAVLFEGPDDWGKIVAGVCGDVVVASEQKGGCYGFDRRTATALWASHGEGSWSGLTRILDAVPGLVNEFRDWPLRVEAGEVHCRSGRVLDVGTGHLLRREPDPQPAGPSDTRTALALGREIVVDPASGLRLSVRADPAVLDTDGGRDWFALRAKEAGSWNWFFYVGRTGYHTTGSAYSYAYSDGFVYMLVSEDRQTVPIEPDVEFVESDTASRFHLLTLDVVRGAVVQDFVVCAEPRDTAYIHYVTEHAVGVALYGQRSGTTRTDLLQFERLPRAASRPPPLGGPVSEGFEDPGSPDARARRVPPPSSLSKFQDEIRRVATDVSARPPRGDRSLDAFREGMVVNEHYRLDARVGEGRVGVTWRSMDLRMLEAEGPGYGDGALRALQMLRLEFLEDPAEFMALQRVVAMHQRLAHPNIVTAYDFDVCRDTNLAFMVTRWAHGVALDDQLRRPGAADRDRALAWIEQLASGIGSAHQRGLIHGNLNPGDCYVIDHLRDRDGELQVSGFIAASRVVEVEGASVRLFAGPSATAVGYASPSVLGGEAPTPEDDVFSAAVIAYELLTGRHPFNGHDAREAARFRVAPAPVDRLARWQNDRLLALLGGRSKPTAEVSMGALARLFRPAPFWKRPWR